MKFIFLTKLNNKITVTKDEKFMHRCIELAYQGLGNVSPNPMVGAVIIHNNKIIGEGYHIKYGEAHAEVNAIKSVKNKELLPESTIYVSLEPCVHYGKTPPCTNLIIENKIPKVVIGSLDPFDKVDGKGIDRLKSAGIEIITGVLKDECDELNKVFFTYHRKKRPYIYLKWAQSIDGFIDIHRTKFHLVKQPTWISNELSRRLVHKHRTEIDAILVGTNTVLKDNPSLTVRDWVGNQPLRVLIDKNNRLPNSITLKDGSCKTVIFTEQELNSYNNVKFVKINFLEDIIPQMLNWFYNNKIQSIVVEGGAMLLKSFIELNLWDEAMVYVGSKWFASGVKAPKFSYIPYKTEKLDDTLLKIFKNSNYFF